MNNINIKFFKSTGDRKIYRLTNSNSKDIYLKLENIHLPFDCQKYNNNYYISAEVLNNDDNYTNVIGLINSFEDHIKKICRDIQELEINTKQFISNVKDRTYSKHIKLMLKKQNNNILLNGDSIDIYKLSEYHKLNNKYDIVLKAEVLWICNDSYGVVFYIHSINLL